MTKRVALFGAGRIGRIHGSNLAAMPGVTLVAVCDPMGDAAAQLASDLNTHLSTPEIVFADASIDVVAIASSTDSHSDLIHRAASAGKQIFCEKPVDLSVQRAQSCAEAVRAAGVACMIGFQRRFDPTFSAAKERLARGEIGAPEMLVVTSRDPGAPPAQYLKASGGIFRDMLIHDFDIFRWILCADGDEAEWLSATGSCLVDPQIATIGDVDSTAVTIRTRKGRSPQNFERPTVAHPRAARALRATTRESADGQEKVARRCSRVERLATRWSERRIRASAAQSRTTCPLYDDSVAASARRCAATPSSIVVRNGWPLCRHSKKCVNVGRRLSNWSMPFEPSTSKRWS